MARARSSDDEPLDLTGIIRRPGHIQIDLRRQGFGKERLDLAPTLPNLRYAQKLRKEILGKIDIDTFSLAAYFPNSPRVKTDAHSLTFKLLAQEWLNSRTNEVAHSTYLEYGRTIKCKHFADWAELMPLQLDYRKLKAKLAQLPAKRAKTYNNLASVLKQVLEYGYKSKVLKEPLHLEIELLRPDDVEPDPLDLGEIELVLSKMRDPIGHDYYEFAFYTGLRPSEQIALMWKDVDLRKGTITVRQALVRGEIKGTKTKKVRTVHLVANARAVLERQRARTQMAGGCVFHGPTLDAAGRRNSELTGGAFPSTDNPSDLWWKPAMRLAGIRYRDARETRHTFATLCLHAGSKPGWAAKQLGHSTEMFYRVYSKWIDSGDSERERDGLDKYLREAKAAASDGPHAAAGSR